MAEANGILKLRVHTDLTGNRFGKLLVLSRDGSRSRKAMWLCRCDCGQMKRLPTSNLKNGKFPSCGCHRGTWNATHRMTKSKVYIAWADMIKRCTNAKCPAYKWYGGRGIKVCDRWLNSLEAFIKDVGEPPTRHHTLDRIDNERDYCPENCRWATRSEQNRNTRVTRLVEYKGERVPLITLAERYGIPYYTLRARLVGRHWPIHDALTTPVRKQRHHAAS